MMADTTVEDTGTEGDGITELEKFDADRVDGVGSPANGTPFLMMKATMGGDGATDGPTHGAYTGTHTHPHAGPGGDHGHAHSHDGDGDHGHIHDDNSKAVRDAKTVALVKLINARAGLDADQLLKAIDANGDIDETPDIAGGQQVIAMLAQLIQYEAQELAAGCLTETYDIGVLLEAVCALKCWLSLEGDASAAEDDSAFDIGGTVLDGDGIDKAARSSAATNDLPDSAFAYIESGGTKDASGKTTPRSLRHFPVDDAAHTRNALARAPQSPFGKKAMPKIRAAAKKFGIEVSDDTGKSVAKGDPTVDTGTDVLGRDQVDQLVAEAVTKALTSSEGRIAALEEELAKVKKLPIPGGPVASITAAAQTGATDEAGVLAARRAAYYEQMAKQMTSPQDADGYRKLARQEREKAGLEDL